MEKKIVILLLALSLVGCVAGYITTNSYGYGICYRDTTTNTYDASCHRTYEIIGNPLFYGMGALMIVFAFLLFMPHAVPSWKKFALWFIPIAALVFIFYPEPGSGDLFAPFPEQVYQAVSGLYVLISLVIAAVSTTRAKV